MLLDTGIANFTTDLDIIQRIRRKRLHGFGMYAHMKSNLRNLTARLALSLPLKKEPLG